MLTELKADQLTLVCAQDGSPGVQMDQTLPLVALLLWKEIRSL